MSILSINNVCKSFYGNKAVDGVSFEVQEGKITSLIGANGAGKTTLFNCLTGYYRADSGEIAFQGTRIEKSSPHKICRLGVARTFQIAKPFGELSVLDNVTVGAFVNKSRRAETVEFAKKCIAFTGLHDKIEMNAVMLNTGEQRRLELARALATKPKLLLLDEVMAGLTPGESGDMIRLIREICDSGVTILMIEHIMPVIMALSDMVYVMDNGCLIASGSPEQVSSDPLVIEAYLGKQIEG